MGDANPIHTLRDYSRPSHEGYRKTIELPKGNNVVPLLSDNIRLLLGVIEYKVDALMKNAISLMIRSEGVFRMTSNELHQLPPEPSRQEEFEHIVMNFILDQEDRTMSKRARSTRGQSSTPKKSRWKKRFGDSECSTMACTKCTMTIIQDASFILGTSLIRNFSPTMVLSKLSSSPSTPTLSLTPNGAFGVKFRLGGEPREISLLELGWRVGLYTKRKYMEHVTLNGLSRAETVNASHLLMEFWPSIRDGGFNVGNTKVASIRDPKVKLAYRCIATTILGRKESTNKVTKIDLYYLYCIYTEGVVCNIPYWLEKYLRSVREKNLICGGMFMTRIAQSFGLLTNEMRDAISVEPLPHVFKKKSLIARGLSWSFTIGYAFLPRHEQSGRMMKPRKRLEGKRSMRGLERFDAWRGQHEALANWMYDHTVYELQYLSTPGVKPITLPMATMDTCLQAMHIVLAHPMMALLDYPCLIMKFMDEGNKLGGQIQEKILIEEQEDPKKCRETKERAIIRAMVNKLPEEWFSKVSRDKDDLEGIIDNLKPIFYDGFIDYNDEAYKQRRNKLLGMPYTEPLPIKKEEVKITKYNLGAGEWKEDICTNWASCNPYFDECDGADNPRENKEY
ncbi:hypothetical protein Tco_0223327 [Tanacetum coccineum]